jgi:hypothetical protein
MNAKAFRNCHGKLLVINWLVLIKTKNSTLLGVEFVVD